MESLEKQDRILQTIYNKNSLFRDGVENLKWLPWAGENIF